MKTTAKTETVFRTFSMDYTMEIHYALATDGRVFTRTRGRGWGGRYQNSAWRAAGCDSIPEGAFNTGRRCRLPMVSSNACERHDHDGRGYCPGCLTEEKDRDRAI